jgi:hypothetical protein
MNVFFLLLILALVPWRGMQAQELFPNTEPASNIPGGVLGLRFSSEVYDEVGMMRYWQALKVMYGVTSDLMITQTISFSNHHGGSLPAEFLSNDGGIGTHTHGAVRGRPYPQLFETYNVNAKYRFLVNDGPNRHFRAAVWGELAFGNEAHDESEPSLMGDNSGVSAGLILTQLYKRTAVSLGLSGVFPRMYREEETGIDLQYGKAFHYTLSFGYLLLPVEYSSYNQVNVNVYAEFMGRAFQGAQVWLDGKPVNLVGAPSLEEGHYLELRPSLQFIFWSNTRCDFSSSFLLLGESFTKFYPVFYFNLQHYFYL